MPSGTVDVDVGLMTVENAMWGIYASKYSIT